MRQFNRITIIGVGLIGGSIGLALKKRGLAGEVVGVFRRRSTLKKAIARGAVDRAEMSVAEGVRGADLVIVATPVLSILKFAAEIKRYARPGAIVTDVGSTKGVIAEKFDRAFGAGPVSFVGSHPMAGSEHTGVEFARTDLLEEAPCIVTPTRNTGKKALAGVVSFWKALGANVKVMSPTEHDRTTAFISHLPHVVAFALAGAVPGDYIACAAEGFRDTTRVASSDPALWADIFLTNRREVINACKAFESDYKKIRKSVLGNDRAGLIAALARAKIKRDKFINGGKK